LIELILIAFSLAMDAFAVSVSSGISTPGFGWRDGVKLGMFFGAFQFLMPLAGWRLGSTVSACIQAVDHWIAFGLLALIGGRMVWESRSEEAQASLPAGLTWRRLTLLALATSIDALAVGVSMAFLGTDILTAAGIIGAVAFALSAAGGILGRRLGGAVQRQAGLAGGLVLIGIGIKILLEG